MSTTYTIICAILGETTSFPIEIESSKIVGILKDMIKEKKPNRFAGVDADELALYDVNISGSKEARIEELKTMADNFGQREELDALRELTQIYSTAPPKHTIHIIVQPPHTGGFLCAGIRRMSRLTHHPR
jgi:Crinkler effector protein N-terminal domain